MFASSRLGDEVVDPPRRRAFEALLAQGQFTDDVQDAFHSRRDAGGEHLSVMMSRADARTMSRTTIEMTGTASVKYEGFTNEGATESSRMEMEVVRPVQEA